MGLIQNICILNSVVKYEIIKFYGAASLMILCTYPGLCKRAADSAEMVHPNIQNEYIISLHRLHLYSIIHISETGEG